MQAFTISAIAFAAPIFAIWVLYRNLWHRISNTPTKWACIAATLALITSGWRPIAYLLLENRQSQVGDALADLLIVLFFYATIGYLAGFLRELIRRNRPASKPTPAKTSSDPIANDSKIDERFFEQALDELHSDNRHKGLWAKSFADAEGNEQKAEALYIKDRAIQMHHQATSEHSDHPQNSFPETEPVSSKESNASYPWFRALE